MALRNYSSAAVGTTLTADITTTIATSCTVAATTGFPATPFIAILEPDTTKEEVVLVTNVATLTLTITRGYDSSTAATHVSGSKLQHSFSAIDFREPNTFLNSGGTVGGNVVISGTLNPTNAADTATAASHYFVEVGSNGLIVPKTLANVQTELLASVPAGNLSGTIPTAVLGNSSVFIGTTSIALNRGTGALTLAGLTLTTPTISDYTNAGHTHAAAASGGTLSGYSPVAGSSSIVTVGAITTGSWTSATLIAGQYGGTGVANTGKTITVSGNTSIGSTTNTVTFTTSGNTSVALPTTGTLEVTGHTHTGTTISSLDAADVTSGIFAIALIPTGSTGTTVSLGDHTHAAVNGESMHPFLIMGA